MLFLVIMLICSASLIGAFYYCFITAGEEKKQILLGVTLPKEALEQEAVKKMAGDYKKKINQCMGILLLAGIPVHGAMAGYLSVFLIIYMIWAVLLYWLPYRILKREHDRMYRMKCENHWTVGEMRTIYVDTQASSLARKYPLSSVHFLIGALICLIPVYVSDSIWEFFQEEMAGVVFATSLMTKLAFFVCYSLFVKRGNRVYSHDTKINQKCSRLKRNIMGNCMVILSYLDSISFVIMEWGMGKEQYRAYFNERMILFCVVQVIEISFLIYSFVRFENRKREILMADKTPILIDEDEYWNGMYYNNPEDKRVLVADRVFESNFTFNMGHPAGKLIVYGITVFTAVSMLWLSVVLLRMDFVPFSMDIREESVNFTAGGYNLEVPLENIEKVTLLSKLPDKRLTKTNGGATDEYLLGKFRMEELGNCYMYVYREYPVIIQVDTKERVIFFNTKEEGKTKELYERLCEAVGE
ncbi:MAG: hypothetical protein HDR22_09530 [Lachnospiraceae bacterium]|nr:hypothetical protein [Lachnospiraceae bacterium]